VPINKEEVVKNRIRIIFLSSILSMIIPHGCKTSGDSNKVKTDGTITVKIDAPADIGKRNIYIKLFEKDANIYDPSVIPLATTRFTLDSRGDGSDTLSYNAVAGEIYQIAGIIDINGIDYASPDKGDLLFKKNTPEVDGNITVPIVENDFQTYSTIEGEGTFTERSIGNHHVSIWHSDTRTGSTSLGWIGDVDNITFKHDGSNGAIGRVGRRYTQIRVDEIDNSTTSVNAEISYSGNGTYYFGVYGWVLDGDSWDTSTIRHEFYVIEDMTRNAETDPHIGSLTVDDIVYEMHRHDFGGGSYRYKAIRTTDRRLSGPINLKPFFEYWRKNGMDNYYLEEITWHIELLGGNHIGTFYCWNIDIPSY
jgi:hypothetical protein